LAVAVQQEAALPGASQVLEERPVVGRHESVEQIRTDQGKLSICKLCSSYPVPALYPKSGVKEPPSTISTADTPAMSFQD